MSEKMEVKGWCDRCHSRFYQIIGDGEKWWLQCADCKTPFSGIPKEWTKAGKTKRAELIAKAKKQ